MHGPVDVDVDEDGLVVIVDDVYQCVVVGCSDCGVFHNSVLSLVNETETEIGIGIGMGLRLRMRLRMYKNGLQL